jgi:putative membrane protein
MDMVLSAFGKRMEISSIAISLWMIGVVASLSGCAHRDGEMMNDANILALISVANNADIEGGWLAQRKGEHDLVRSYGARMEREHIRMINQAATLSKQLAVKPVLSATGQDFHQEHQRASTTLTEVPSGAFDELYIDHAIRMHERAIRDFDRAVGMVERSELRKWLKQARPRLEEHLQAAKEVKQTLSRSRR